VIGLLEERIGTARNCPHCAAGGAVIRGRYNGLKRYFCKICSKTFNALIPTAELSDPCPFSICD
jgi:transposase-like protein